MGIPHSEKLDSPPDKGYLDSEQIAEFKDRTRKLGEELKSAKAEGSSLQEDKEDRANQMRGMSLGIRLSSEMVASIFVGTLMGYGIDYVFGTKPLFFILFMLLGFIAGVFNVIKGFQKLQLEINVHKGLDKKDISTNNAE